MDSMKDTDAEISRDQETLLLNFAKSGLEQDASEDRTLADTLRSTLRLVNSPSLEYQETMLLPGHTLFINKQVEKNHVEIETSEITSITSHETRPLAKA